jgi:arsenate reductase
MFEILKQNCTDLSKMSISKERQEILQPLIDYIQIKIANNQTVRLHFICTHNSRRSHLAQVWSQTMAFQFKIKNVFCYSGGTETTALFPKIADTLKNQGFEIQIISSQSNPIYSIKFDENEQGIIGFSKVYSDAFNPQSEFAAILTCSQADEGCPFIPGAEKRIPITFDDPKEFDNSPMQTQKYAERSMQIAAEMYYVFSKIKK